MAGGGISQKPHFSEIRPRWGMWPGFSAARASNFLNHWSVYSL